MLGKLLKEELLNRGLKFKFVASKTGIPYGSFMHYLNGYKNMPESKLRVVCLTFEIPLKKFGLDDYLSSQKEAS